MKKNVDSKKINVLLLSKIYRLGSKFDIKSVKLGFFLNYLLPKGLAIKYDSKVDALVQEMKAKEANRVHVEYENAQKMRELSESLKNKKILFVRLASKNGGLFESVKPKHVCEQLNIDYGVKDLHARDVFLNAIREYGVYSVKINLGYDVMAEMYISVAGSIEDANNLYNSYISDLNKDKKGEKQ